MNTNTATTATTWADVQNATAALDKAEADYDATPSDEASERWEAARDALNDAIRSYKAGRA